MLIIIFKKIFPKGFLFTLSVDIVASSWRNQSNCLIDLVMPGNKRQVWFGYMPGTRGKVFWVGLVMLIDREQVWAGYELEQRTSSVCSCQRTKGKFGFVMPGDRRQVWLGYARAQGVMPGDRVGYDS